MALHDAFGVLNDCDTYATYTSDFVGRDLAAFFAPSTTAAGFRGRFPAQYLAANPPRQMRAWHLVGGLDPIDDADLTGKQPDDGYPVTLLDWIARDGLTCLKIKLRGNDGPWDYARIVRVGQVALGHGMQALCADFNCTVTDPEYVNEILDRLAIDEPAIFEIIRYIEQPFPYDLDAYPIDVHSVSRRKPLFLDEKRPRLDQGGTGAAAGLDRGGAEDLQNANRGPAQSGLGQGARHAADGPGPDQSDAGPDTARPPGRLRRDAVGGRNQLHAVLSRGFAARGGSPSRLVSPAAGDD